MSRERKKKLTAAALYKIPKDLLDGKLDHPVESPSPDITKDSQKNVNPEVLADSHLHEHPQWGEKNRDYEAHGPNYQRPRRYQAA